MFGRRESEQDDQARTTRLLDAVDRASEGVPADQPMTPFEVVVLDGLGCGAHCTEYPPAGHGYPRRDG
ncbi:hypothetical protein ACFY1A_48240 [Streptomyces sp. NPDC001520]|uniref:hypothetical protein n=1 Tax=Streptomyces sp. NPDC001520 TaxID=3364581 RepID=UPI00367FE0BA